MNKKLYLVILKWVVMKKAFLTLPGWNISFFLDIIREKIKDQIAKNWTVEIIKKYFQREPCMINQDPIIFGRIKNFRIYTG